MRAVITRQYETLRVIVKSDILTVTLQRPEKKNAMSFAMMRELIELAKDIKSDRYLRAVIINGAQDNFCAGIDLGDLNDPKQKAFALWELVKPMQSLFQKVCLIWQDMPVPVVAVLQGHCIGAGLQLALGCDIRITTPTCKLSIMEAKWGLVPDMGLSQSTLNVIPADVLKELAMTARIIDGDTALNLNVVTHVSDAPYEQAYALCEEFALRSPDAVLASKRLINRMYRQSYRTLYLEKKWQIKLMLGHNRKLAISKVKDASIRYAKRQFS